MDIKNPHEPMNLLLIEDNIDDIRDISDAITNFDIPYSLNLITNSLDALLYLTKKEKYINAITPDLILMSWQLPNFTSHSLLEKIKSNPILRITPILVLCDLKEESEDISAYNFYANARIAKPIDKNQLMLMIKAIETFWFKVVQLPSRLNLYVY